MKIKSGISSRRSADMHRVTFWVISQPNIEGFCSNLAHLKALPKTLEDLGPETAVSVLGTRPRPRSELKTLDRLDDTD